MPDWLEYYACSVLILCLRSSLFVTTFIEWVPNFVLERSDRLCAESTIHIAPMQRM